MFRRLEGSKILALLYLLPDAQILGSCNKFLLAGSGREQLQSCPGNSTSEAKFMYQSSHLNEEVLLELIRDVSI